MNWIENCLKFIRVPLITERSVVYKKKNIYEIFMPVNSCEANICLLTCETKSYVVPVKNKRGSVTIPIYHDPNTSQVLHSVVKEH